MATGRASRLFQVRTPKLFASDTLTFLYFFFYCRQLAQEAEKNMEAVTPPLFLRFVNLLMNDAVFLLDESLSNMAQLKTMQTARSLFFCYSFCLWY